MNHSGPITQYFSQLISKRLPVRSLLSINLSLTLDWDIAGASCGHGGLRHCEEDQARAVRPARHLQDRRQPGEQFRQLNFKVTQTDKIEFLSKIENTRLNKSTLGDAMDQGH